MAGDDLLLGEITLTGAAASARLTDAVIDDATLTRTIDGAATLELAVVDARRALLRSGIFSTRSFARIGGLGYELVSVDKSADRIALTFEDSLVAAARRRTDPRSWAAGTTTRARILTDLSGELPAPAQVDPTDRGLVNAAINRSADGQVTDSWSLSGTVATDAGWRRFSTGTDIVAGSDAWLAARFPPLALAEFTGPVQGIDFRYDVALEQASASVAIDAEREALPIGSAVTLSALGPADGAWLVAKYTRSLTRSRASVELVRSAPVLPEAPPEAPPAEANIGEPDLIPGAEAPTVTASSVPASSAREKFLQAAMSKNGLPYIWGGTGPRGYDCSGLVQYAARVAGRPISRVVSTQWADARRAGKVISVAEGLRTRGAILVRGGEHTAISLGNGSTFEARGKAYKIGTFTGAARRTWTGAYIWI